MHTLSRVELLKIIQNVQVKDVIESCSDKRLEKAYADIKEEGLKRLSIYNATANKNFREFLLQKPHDEDYNDMINTLTIFRPELLSCYYDDDIEDDIPLIKFDFEWKNMPVTVELYGQGFGVGLLIKNLDKIDKSIRGDRSILLHNGNEDFVPNCEGIRFIEGLKDTHPVYKFLDWFWGSKYLIRCKVRNFQWPLSPVDYGQNHLYSLYRLGVFNQDYVKMTARLQDNGDPWHGDPWHGDPWPMG